VSSGIRSKIPDNAMEARYRGLSVPYRPKPDGGLFVNLRHYPVFAA